MQKAAEEGANNNTKEIAPVVVFSKCNTTSSNNCQLRRRLFTSIPLLLVVIFLLALGNLIMTRPQNYEPIVVATITRRKEGNSSSSSKLIIILGDKKTSNSSSSSPPQLKRNSSTISPTEEDEEELLTITKKQENDTQHLLSSSSTTTPQLKRNSSTSSPTEDEEESPSITRKPENDTHHLLSSSTAPPTPTRSSSSSWTIMTTINFAFLDFFYNWIHHYDKLNLTLDMILVAEDDITFDHLQKFRTSYYKSKYNITTTINTTDTSTGSTNSRRGGEVERGEVVPDIIVERSSLQLNKKGVSTNTSFGWGEMNYKIMMSARPKLIRKKLEAGYNIIFTDVDFIWQKNPIPFFTNNKTSSSSSSQMYNSMDPNKVRCGGFWACRSTPETIKFAKKWEKRLKKKGPSHNQAPFNFVINRMVRMHEIKTTQLSNKDFLNGNNIKRYNSQQRSEATALHFNMVTKFDSKKEQMTKYGYWAL